MVPMDLVTMATSADAGRAGHRVGVLPIGSFEQHGSHLPLATDTIVAAAVASALADAYPLLLLPPVTMSCSHEHSAWPGTVSLSAATLTSVINDVRASLMRSGVGGLVLVNGHGGNYVLSNIVQEATVDSPTVVLFPGRDDWHRARVAAGLGSTGHQDMHAGELETSILLHACPQVVRPGNADADHDAPDRPHLLTQGMRAYTDSGVIGRPSLGTAEKGKAILDDLADSFADYMRIVNTRG
jgi:creatinine amidohydrolase